MSRQRVDRASARSVCGASYPMVRMRIRPAGERGRHLAYGEEVRRRRRIYFIMMGTCLTLFLLAWTVVRFYSQTLAVVMSLVALVIPPFAAIVANRSDDGD